MNNSTNSPLDLNDSSVAFTNNIKDNERTTTIRTQQASFDEKTIQIKRNNSIRSVDGRITGRKEGRNPLIYQNSLPTKYEYETPGQTVKINIQTEEDLNLENKSQTDITSTITSNHNSLIHNNSYNQLYHNSESTRNSLTVNSPRPKLVYQPASNDSENTPSTIHFNDSRSETRSVKEDNCSIADKFKSNYDKFIEISRNIDFEEKLINLQLNKSKLKASARTSALLAGFGMVALVEISFNDYDDEATVLNETNYNHFTGSSSSHNVTVLPEFLIILFSLCTTLLVSVNILALMISTCLLPFIESISNSYNWLNDNEFKFLNDEFYDLAENLKALNGKVSVLEGDGKEIVPKICIIVDD